MTFMNSNMMNFMKSINELYELTFIGAYLIMLTVRAKAFSVIASEVFSVITTKAKQSQGFAVASLRSQ